MELCSLHAIYLGPNYGGGNEDNGDPLKDPMHVLLHSVPLILQQATTNPRLCQRLPDTLRQVEDSLLWSHCSFLLGLGAQVSVVPSNNLFPSPL